MRRVLGAIVILCFQAGAVWAGPEDAYLKTAQILYETAADYEEAQQEASYRQVREILDRIVAEYPTSDTAVRILLQDSFDGLDVAALDAALANFDAAPKPQPTESTTNASAPETKAPAAQVVEMEPATPLTAQVQGDATLVTPEVQLPTRSEKEIVQEVQAELNRLGCNAGTPDGVAGRNTKAAFRNFLSESGSTLTEADLATEAAVSELKSSQGTICTVRVMASTPASALSGSWGFRSACPGLGNTTIRNSGRLRMKYVGSNTLRGTVTNQQGISGPAVIQFQGGRRAATKLRFGFVSLQGNLTRSTQNMSISGTGSRRCRISLWKN